MKEENVKKGSNNLVVFLLLFIIVLLGVIIYFELNINNKNNNNTEVVEKEEVKDEEKEVSKKLNIESDLVKNLYKKVAVDKDSYDWYLFWKTAGENSKSYDKVMVDLDTKTMSEESKMALLDVEPIVKTKSCNELKDIKVSEAGEYLDCSDGNNNNVLNVNDVERLYKEMYGTDAVLNKNIPINTTEVEYPKYIYNEKENLYLLFSAPLGNTSYAGGFKTKLVNAYETGNKIEIYQEVKFIEYATKNGMIDEDAKEIVKQQEQGKFKYTFEKELNGNYKFVSRVVVK